MLLNEFIRLIQDEIGQCVTESTNVEIEVVAIDHTEWHGEYKENEISVGFYDMPMNSLCPKIKFNIEVMPINKA